jgi:predicted metal-dependent peptidase
MRTTLPGKYGHRTGKICLAADTSGSISLEEQSLYTAALGEIFATCMPKELWFLEIDTYVRRARRILTAPELAAVTCTNGGFHGGGGTNMPAIWEWLEEQKIVPDLLLVLTDMHTPWPEKLAPVKDVVWVSTNKMGLTAPIGRTVPMGKR